MNTQNETPRRGRPGICQKDVDTIAFQLVTEGKRPTNELVRVRLGTGSPAKICEYMKIWWATQNTNSDSSCYDISLKFLTAINSEIASHVAATTKESNELRIEAEKDREVISREVGELTEQLNLLETKNTKLETEIAEKNGVLSTLRENLNDAIKGQKEVGNERERIALELAEVRATTRHMEPMVAEVHELRERLASTVNLLSTNDAMLAAATARNEQLQISLVKTQSEFESLKHELTEVREAANASVERVLVELSDARRQADQHISGLVINRAGKNQPEIKNNPEYPGQHTKSLVGGLVQNKKLKLKSEDLVSQVSPRNIQRKILINTAEILHAGPMKVESLRDELEKRGVELAGAKNIKNLSSILSSSTSIQYDRQAGGWKCVGESSNKGKAKSPIRKSAKFGAS
jgi:chromosome segregation ATPase